MRLFFALQPDNQARERLARSAALAQRRTGGRRLPADSLHLTLAFLGETRAEQLPALVGLTCAEAIAPGALLFERFGVFRRRRIVWAGFGTPRSLYAGEAVDETVRPPSDALPGPAEDAEPTDVSALLDLQRDLLHRLCEIGVAVREEPFRPHVSLLRNAMSSDIAGQLAGVPFEPVRWAFSTLSLMASEPGGGRHRYVELARSPSADQALNPAASRMPALSGRTAI